MSAKVRAEIKEFLRYEIQRRDIVTESDVNKVIKLCMKLTREGEANNGISSDNERE